MSLPAEAAMRAYLENLRAAREVVRMHALEFAPHLEHGHLVAILAAVGPMISIDEAIAEIDRAETRAAVEH